MKKKISSQQIIIFFSVLLIGLIIYALSLYAESDSTNSELCSTCSVVSFPLTGGVTSSSSLDNVQGTKRAVLFGCNYNYTGSACVRWGCTLNGCINDVQNIRLLLISKFGYLPANVEVIVDDGTSFEFPSKETIIRKLTNIVNSAQAGDKTFVWYSGHGAQLQNIASDGGFDECWCPPDTIQNGDYLTDNELNNIVSNLVAGSTIFIGSDSCHSGTVFDLKYIVQEPNGTFSNRQMNSIRGRENLSAEKLNRNLVGGNAVTERILTPRSYGSAMLLIEDSFYEKTIGNIICLSGCQDYDTSADAWVNSSAQGAMSWAFQQVLDPTMSVSDTLRNMRSLLISNGYPQIPQITMGTIMNPNSTTMIEIL